MQPSSIRASAIALCALAGLTTACEQNDFSQSDPSNSEPSAASTRDVTVQDTATAINRLKTTRPEASRPETSEASRLAATIANLPALRSRSALPALPRIPTLTPPALPLMPSLWHLPQTRRLSTPAIAQNSAPNGPVPTAASDSSNPAAPPLLPTSSSAAGANPNAINAAAPAAIARNPATPGTPSSQSSDIQGHWSQPLVTALMQAGIIQGFMDGNFRPDQPITQEQFLSMVKKAFPDEEVRPETVPLRPGMTRAEAAKVIYQALADQGRVAPLATLVATQNQPFNSANATANPSNSAGAIANPLSPSQPNSLPSPQPNPQPDQVGAASPAATNLTATPSSVNAGSENPANLEAVVQPGPQPVNPLVEPTVEPSPQPVNALIEPTAEPSPQPADLPESAASPRPAVGSAMPAAASTASIVVAGEVSHPGAYSLDANATRQPTLIQAIQMAGGVTTKANIRQIQVHRGTTILPLDLWQLLQSGDLGKDIVLQPGDMISVPRAAELSSARKERVPPTPAQIQVSVVGEVKKPGRLRLPSNTSVNQAILASGGFNRQTQKAELIRLNTNGTIARRVLTVDLAQGTNESSNPRLQNNDVILVQHTGTATIASGRVALPTLISILPTTPAHNRAAL